MSTHYYLVPVEGEGTEENPFHSPLMRYMSRNHPEHHFIKQNIYPPSSMYCTMRYDVPKDIHQEIVENIQNIYVYPENLTDVAGTLSSKEIDLMLSAHYERGFNVDWFDRFRHRVIDLIIGVTVTMQLADWGRILVDPRSFSLETIMSGLSVEELEKIRKHMKDIGVVDTSVLDDPASRAYDVIHRIQYKSNGSPRLWGSGPYATQVFFTDNDFDGNKELRI